jgi:hypothetical protein
MIQGFLFVIQASIVNMRIYVRYTLSSKKMKIIKEVIGLFRHAGVFFDISITGAASRRTCPNGLFQRQPAFAIRCMERDGSQGVEIHANTA